MMTENPIKENLDKLSPEEKRIMVLQSLGLPLDSRDEDVSKAQELMEKKPNLTLKDAYGMIKFQEEYDKLSPEEKRIIVLQTSYLKLNLII